MEYKSQYVEAILHVIDAVKNSDPSYWFPKVASVKTVDNRPDGQGYFVYDLGNGETGSGSGHSGTDQGHAQTAALLRLIRFKEPCTLFAFPVGDWKGLYIPEDVVVGFMSDVNDKYVITPAWKGKYVYPRIGNSHNYKCNIPPNAKWALCAALDSPHRKAVSLYCQASNAEELEQCTPQLNVVTRNKPHRTSCSQACSFQRDGVARQCDEAVCLSRSEKALGASPV